MEILTGIIWIVVGVVYVVYNPIKENPGVVPILLKFVVFPMSLLCGSYLLIEYIFVDIIGGIESLFLAIIIVLTPLVAVGILVWHMINKTDERNAERHKNLKTDLPKRFRQLGYNVSGKTVNRLIDDYSSPIYNSKKTEVLIRDCYRWLCINRESELYRLSKEQLGKELGVPIEDIPLNPNKTLGSAVLQRKALAMKYILQREGLQLTDFCCGQSWFHDTSKYPASVEQYITEHKNSDPNNDSSQNT